jgi:hypothetical protein
MTPLVCRGPTAPLTALLGDSSTVHGIASAMLTAALTVRSRRRSLFWGLTAVGGALLLWYKGMNLAGQILPNDEADVPQPGGPLTSAIRRLLAARRAPASIRRPGDPPAT